MTKHILTTSFLLLSFFTYTAAQNRLDGFKDWGNRQTLEGLGEIGLIVKYDQVDGLATTIQPSILQMLVERAKNLLRQGEVALLESIDEANMVGRPRLVVTVTVKKQSDTAPALIIESKLFQRVRLWRDPSQEIELATWSWSAGSPNVDYEMLSTRFDMQVSAFVKDYQAANAKPPRVENRTTEPPAQLKGNANALQGLSGIDYITSLEFIEFVDPHLQPLADKLRPETENKLKQAGIPLLRASDMARAGYPLLKVRVTLNPNGKSYAHAIEVRTEFWQRVCSVQDLKKYTYTPTWQSHTIDGSSITEEAVRRLVNSQLDQFIEAYKSANPSSVKTVKATIKN